MATIEIDGKKLEAENGQTIIEIADLANIPIPRFCYHKKLSRPANCRMCLVEIENGRKPVPACTTPVTDGMKIFTQSEATRRSQKAVMEFLLINHPLDCPICDQGGECELQDVATGYGRDVSEYEEAKRVVNDDNLGSLIATDMTRCIHCTRCVRFGDEIAGLRELGATGRGEHTQIGTYVEHSMRSEISGNIIDLCPVGALTSKPFRFTARPWELTAYSGIAPHDCLGSHIELQVRRNEIMRVVPRECDTINETWLSDRDRFSYVALKHEKRALHPKIKKDGQWQVVDWETALRYTATLMERVITQHGASQVAAFASPSSTLEEFYLLQKLMRGLGVLNVDYRLKQTDFRDAAHFSQDISHRLPYAALEKQKNIFIFGTHLIEEAPLMGVRLRKAKKQGAAIYVANPYDFDWHVSATEKAIISSTEMVFLLAKIIVAMVNGDLTLLPEELQSLLVGIEADAFSTSLSKVLLAESSVICTGALFENHPHAAILRTFVSVICERSETRWLRLTEGANAAGAELVGMVPHRDAAGHLLETPGLDVSEALKNKLKAYFLMNVSPIFDIENPSMSRQAMLAAECVIALTAFESEAIEEYADIILPIAAPFETSGTYVNVDETWQHFTEAVSPPKEAKPGWKILRVLGNFLKLPQFDDETVASIVSKIRALTAMQVRSVRTGWYPNCMPEFHTHLTRLGVWPIYRIDSFVRHAIPLQETTLAEKAVIRVHPALAEQLELSRFATVSQGDIKITLPLEEDARLARDVVWVANGLSETLDLGAAFGTILIQSEKKS